jgi:undecaprenyl phosphate-alpha-L-ara4N flippase subunit ArnE
MAAGFLAGRKLGLVWILFSVLLQSTAGVFAKQAALMSYGSGAAAIVLNGWYVLGLTSLACQAVCWIMALRHLPLSFAYPITSLVFVLNLLAARLIFGETIAVHNLVGVGIIVLGVILVNSRRER